MNISLAIHEYNVIVSNKSIAIDIMSKLSVSIMHKSDKIYLAE